MGDNERDPTAAGPANQSLVPEETFNALANRTPPSMAGAALVALVGILAPGTGAVSGPIVTIVACIAVLAFCFEFFRHQRKLDARLKRTEQAFNISLDGPRPVWSGLVWKRPFGDELERSVIELLGQVHTHARTALEEMAISGFDPKGVRANVFLPDVTDAGHGEVLALHIPRGFSINLSPAPSTSKSDMEDELRFRPNEGLTGLVFVAGTAGGASKVRGEWTRTFFGEPTPAAAESTSAFRLNQWQLALIHQDLRWIVSYPLLVEDGKRDQAVGVLNVDGIGFDLTDAQLRTLKTELHQDADRISREFRQAPAQRLSIVLQDIRRMT